MKGGSGLETTGSDLCDPDPKQVHVGGGTQKEGQLDEQQCDNEIANNEKGFTGFVVTKSVLDCQSGGEEADTGHKTEQQGDMVRETMPIVVRVQTDHRTGPRKAAHIGVLVVVHRPLLLVIIWRRHRSDHH